MAITQRPEPNGVVALNDPLATPLGKMIEPYRAQLTPFLRDGATLERVAAELVLASRKTPHMDECQPEALVDAVCRALATGGIIGQDVYIVPFKDNKKNRYEPTVMLDYKFKAELVIQAGGARSIDARPVWEGDTFRISYGSAPRIEHEPAPSTGKKRKLIGAYAVAFLGFNHLPKIHFMSLEEVEAIRAKSKQWAPKDYNGNPRKGLEDCPAWYACARAVHQIVKLLPKNPKLRAVAATFEREDEDEFGATARMERPADVDVDGVDLTYGGEDDHTVPVRAADKDTAAALAYPVPFGDYKGKPLGEVKSLNYLRGVEAWALKQKDAPSGFGRADELLHMVRVVIDVRESEAEEERLKVSNESAEVFGSGSLGPILPGEVEGERAAKGELPLADKPRTAKNAVAEGR